MSTVVISEFMEAAAVERMRQHFDVLYDLGLHGQPERLLHLLEHARALIVRNQTQVNEALLTRAARLQVIGRLGVGLENIDLDACHRRNIKVIPATGANADAVAEYVVCTAMMLLRRAYGATSEVMNGAWPRNALAQGQEIGGKTLGIIGLGSVGLRTAQLALALNMQVIAYDPKPRGTAHRHIQLHTDLESVLRQADVISLHVPLTPVTRHLIHADRLKQMKPGAVLINVARGGIVDERALVAALQHGHLGGAAIDVYEEEPLQESSVFAGVPNLILTPHIAGVTRESNQRVSDMIATQVARHLHTHPHRETTP